MEYCNSTVVIDKVIDSFLPVGVEVWEQDMAQPCVDASVAFK